MKIYKYFKDLMNYFRKRMGRLYFAIAMFLFLAVVAGLTGWHIAENPRFCSSCHNMDPYIASWKNSTHKNVSCVECHYEPGFKNHLKGKFTDGQLSLMYFITGKGPSKPHAEISDTSCEQCHPYEKVIEKPIDFKGVNFDHKHHLGSLRIGMKLRCTSCHSQIVQGQHLTVTESVCFHCHFYKTFEDDPQTTCRTCHATIKDVITIDGLEFKHGEYIKRGLKCTACHKYVIKGDGHVPEGKCVQCHDKREIIEATYTPEHLHQNHVTLHKVECFICHTTFEHRIVKEFVATPDRCDKCHASSMHSPQHDLYLGKGGIGVEGNPFRMFQSHIDCSGCHAPKSPDMSSPFSSGFNFKSIESNCVDCHGEGFDKILENWEKVLNDAQNNTYALMSRFEAAWRAVPQAQKQNENLRKAEKYADEARYNYSFVTMAKGIHNVEYALQLLNVADKKIALAYNLISAKKMEQVQDLKVGCSELCHTKIREKDIKLVDAVFSHSLHIDSMNIDCIECHTPRINHGHTLMNNCNTCHHENTSISCSNCHKDVANIYAGKGGTGVPETPSLKAQKEISCKDCHYDEKKQKVAELSSLVEFCKNCHDEKEAVTFFNDWNKNSQKILIELHEKRNLIEELMTNAQKKGMNVDPIERKFIQVKNNHELIKKGNPVHNMQYTELLAQYSIKISDEMIKELNKMLYQE